MCGRYYSLFDKQQVAEQFHVRHTADNVGIIAPNYNVAPGDPQPVIRRSRETGEHELVMMRWGIVPWFAKSELEFKKDPMGRMSWFAVSMFPPSPYLIPPSTPFLMAWPIPAIKTQTERLPDPSRERIAGIPTYRPTERRGKSTIYASTDPAEIRCRAAMVRYVWRYAIPLVILLVVLMVWLTK